MYFFFKTDAICSRVKTQRKKSNIIKTMNSPEILETDTFLDNERTMTSAISNMSVADVRKALANMRKDWAKHSCVQPFFTSAKLTEELSVSEFAFKFVMGHHHKRHSKS